MIILLWLFTIMQCDFASRADLSDQVDTQLRHMFDLIYLASVYLNSLRDTSHMHDLTQDKNICRGISSNKKKCLIHQYPRSHYLVIFYSNQSFLSKWLPSFQARDIWPLFKTTAARICETAACLWPYHNVRDSESIKQRDSDTLKRKKGRPRVPWLSYKIKHKQNQNTLNSFP